MQTSTNTASTPLLTKTKPSRFHILLGWAAEDLTNTAIRSDSPRLAQERQVVVKRLEPYIEELVQLAWKQLQQDQAPDSSSRSKP